MSNRLVTTQEMLACYRIKAVQTLWKWRFESDNNPLPAPIGNSKPSVWYENDLVNWEKKKYGREIISAFLDRTDELSRLQARLAAQADNDTDHKSPNRQAACDQA